MYTELFERILKKAGNGGFDLNTFAGFEESTIIFSHEFAKAYWDKELVHITKGGNKKYHGSCNWAEYEYYEQLIENWQYHLQQMVLEEEPLLYLEKFL